jgi:hypothetical protein
MVGTGAVRRGLVRRGSVGLGLAGLVATGLGVTAAGPAAAGTAPATARDGFTPPLAAGTASPGIGGPRRHGRLRITGRLRDGGVVAAAGLGWRPGRLPAGDHLLSFEVSYAWRACDRAGRRCVTGAGTTATPFAARRYRVGHADTGRRLRVTETATEVVATSRAGSGFTVVRASASANARRAAGAYPAGRPPVSTLVNGTPEARTGSDAEWFQVSAPHYRAAAGPARQWYRVDTGRWRPLGPSRAFYAGGLRPGRHRVAVRTADRAGATVLRFGWRVTPLAAPVACRPARRCWYPQHLGADHRPMRWDWQIGRAAPLERTGARAVDIYDLDGFLTTRAELRALHTRWPAATLRHPRAICYLDLAWEDYRPDASPGRYFPADTLGKVYYGYPEERWVDFRQLDALKPMLDERLAMCARKGFDAVELDDIDSFDPPSQTGFRLTPGDAQNYLAYALNQVHRDGMTALWKNSPYLSWWGRRYADGAIVEECYVYHMCFASSLRGSRQYGITCTALAGRTPCGWDDFSTDRTARQPTGKWVGEAEYSADHYVCNPGQRCPVPRRFATFCQRVWAPAYGFAAVKFDVDLDGRMFFPCPRGR